MCFLEALGNYKIQFSGEFASGPVKTIYCPAFLVCLILLSCHSLRRGYMGWVVNSHSYFLGRAGYFRNSGGPNVVCETPLFSWVAG